VEVARIAGIAGRHARRRALTTAQEDAAVAELLEVAAGRGDLLAQYAGLAVGCHEGDPDESRYLLAAQMCINAGADTSLIPQWIEEGRRRARTAHAERLR
jgi:hypothetical protein